MPNQSPDGIRSGPKRVVVNGAGDSEDHSLKDQIALDRYRRANAAGKIPGGFFGIRRKKLIAPGTVFEGNGGRCG